VIVAASLATVILAAALPVFRQHPFALLYASALFAAWYGEGREGLAAVAVGAGTSALLLPRFPALPLEEAIFVGASLLLLALVQRLRWAQTRAEAAVRERDAVVALVSHDLKNPLTAITGQVRLLQQRAVTDGTTLDGRLATGLDRIDAAATRLARLVNELLDVAQVQAGAPLALERRPTDLVALARRAAAEHQPSGATHRIHVAADVPRLVGLYDAFRLERVLDNLLSNAIKYSPAGSDILVTVGQAPDGTATLSVRDRGLGIPAADLPRVFERFHRAGNVAGHIQGTGLGLAGVRAIIAQHGGRITLDSTLGRGTTVTVTLLHEPAATGDVPAQEGASAPASSPPIAEARSG